MSRLPKGNDLLSLRPGSRCPASVLAVGLRCCNSFPLSLQHDFALELSDAADEVHEKVASPRLVSNSLKAYSGRPSVRTIFCQIAVALAAQSTSDNLFGGFSIFADRPFRIGDAIQYSGEHGRREVRSDFAPRASSATTAASPWSPTVTSPGSASPM